MYDSKIKCLVESIDFEKFSDFFVDDDGGFIKFGKGSTIHEHIEIESTDDNRDIEIKKALTDNYEVKLDHDDVSLFVELVENEKCIICDLTLDRNKPILQYVQEIKEKKKYTESYILDNIEKDYKFLRMTTLSNLPHKLFTDYPDKFNWDRISFLDLPMTFIDKNHDNINWGNIDYESLSTQMFAKYYNKLKIPKVVHNLLPLELKGELEINKALDI